MPDTAGSEYHVQTSLRGIARVAGLKRHHRFRDLYRLINLEMLQIAWKKLNKSKAIADRDITVEGYKADLNGNLTRLADKVKQKRYKAKLVRRKYILKENGKQRPLGNRHSYHNSLKLQQRRKDGI